MKNQLIKEVFLTVFILAVYKLLLLVPMPFIDYREFSLFFDNVGTLFIRGNRLSFISITALGIMPFCSAFIIIEVLSLFLPFLQKHRSGDYAGRVTLRKYALGLTLILSVVQGYYIISGLEGLVSPSGMPILALDGNLQFFALLTTLVAAV